MNASGSSPVDLLACPSGHAVDVEEYPYPMNRSRSLWTIHCVHDGCGWRMSAASRERCISQWNNRIFTAELSATQALLSENVALRKDAERYRWLREHECVDALYAHGFTLKGDTWLDETIDAELAALITSEPEHGKGAGS